MIAEAIDQTAAGPATVTVVFIRGQLRRIMNNLLTACPTGDTQLPLMMVHIIVGPERVTLETCDRNRAYRYHHESALPEGVAPFELFIPREEFKRALVPGTKKLEPAWLQFIRPDQDKPGEVHGRLVVASTDEFSSSEIESARSLTAAPIHYPSMDRVRPPDSAVRFSIDSGLRSAMQLPCKIARMFDGIVDVEIGKNRVLAGCIGGRELTKEQLVLEGAITPLWVVVSGRSGHGREMIYRVAFDAGYLADAFAAIPDYTAWHLPIDRFSGHKFVSQEEEVYLMPIRRPWEREADGTAAMEFART